MMFLAAQEELGRSAADRAAQNGEKSTSSLAATFTTLVLQIASSAQLEAVWACRAVDAVDQALKCVPLSTQDDFPAMGADRCLAILMLLVLPLYSAAAAGTVMGAAVLTLVASSFPAYMLMALQTAERQKARGIGAQDLLATRLRLFNIRLSELRMLCDNPPRTPDVVLAAYPSKERNKPQIATLPQGVQGVLKLSPSVAHIDCKLPYEDDPDGQKVPLFTRVDDASSPHVARAVPLPAGAVTPKVLNTKSAEPSLAQVLGEIGTLDQRALMQSLGQKIISILPEPETPDGTMRMRQPRHRQSPIVTPMAAR